LIDDELLASCGRPTDCRFAQPEVLANLRCRQTRMPNRPVDQSTAGTYAIGLFSGDDYLVFFNAKDFCSPRLFFKSVRPYVIAKLLYVGHLFLKLALG